MAKIIIVFASLTGNTEEMANLVAKGVEKAGITPVVRQLPDVAATEILDYDGILLGSYTYGDGDLADEFFDFYKEMDDLDLAGKVAAAFGSGDTSYEHYCKAVDDLEEKLKERGAVIVQEGLKVELEPEDEDQCIAFGKEFAATVKEVLQGI